MRMTIQKVRLLIGVLSSLFLISPASAQGDQSLRGKLEQAIEVASQNQLKIVSLNQTALPNIFEVELNTGEVLYSDISGDYLFAGDMYATSQWADQSVGEFAAATRTGQDCCHP